MIKKNTIHWDFRISCRDNHILNEDITFYTVKKKDLLITIFILMIYLEQKVSKSNEGGPVIRFWAPALQHDIVNVLWTVVWFTQPLSFHIHLVQDL